jgi:hypothetical protein
LRHIVETAELELLGRDDLDSIAELLQIQRDRLLETLTADDDFLEIVRDLRQDVSGRNNENDGAEAKRHGLMGYLHFLRNPIADEESESTHGEAF